MPDENGFGKYFTQMKTMVLIELHQLAHIWNKDPTGIFVLENLQIIHIKSCSSLKYLFTPSAAEKLSQLNELKLEGFCGILKSLFSLSSVKNLGKLKLLKLHSCEKIEEVISNENNENVSIIFPLMECLMLKDLPKLVNFCQQNETLNWPKLQIVRIINIPSMEKFSSGNLNTPLLRSIHVTFAKKIWLGSLYNTISYMHNNPGM
uniref:Disease resistance protein At4g27190-like leucine-rich repeats domain-containing protein n=1 Tax=Cajanus cajan TaxID=3821 RepID=A0A151QR45_CAJCA|nr:hypothetical protein KK1_046452 [Cajanus cajan]